MRQTMSDIRPGPIRTPRRKALWLGWVAGLTARLLPTPAQPVTGADLRKQDYRASTQRMGVRFNERIRDVFRFRWIREIF